jgi:FixJ family two-component response regulator
MDAWRGRAYPSCVEAFLSGGEVAAVAEKPMISIVDDDPAVRSALWRLMDTVGLVAETFASAEEFLASPSMSVTTCLILDVRMPGIDGLGLQRRLREANWKIPIIFISAHADEEARAEALEGGAVAFFAKPFRTEALLDAIDAARGGRPPTPASA